MARVLITASHRMRTSLRIAVLLGGLALAGAAPAEAQTTGNNCLVRQAADAAVQRQIALIDAAKVNPNVFFNGPNSCIAGDLLKRFDLSNLIPDLSGYLTTTATNLVNDVINAARRQVCQVLDNQLREMIGSINTQMSSFQNTLSGDLFRQLNGSISPITLPNITGLGSYPRVELKDSALGSALNLSQSPQSASPVVVQQSAPAPAAAPAISAPATSGTGSSFGDMFR